MRLEEMKKNAGMIIPVWYPESMSREEMQNTLRPCLEDAAPFCAAENLLTVIDGAPAALAAVVDLQAKHGGFEILALDKNLGKGGAVAAGIKKLMENPILEFFVTRDHDNDHLANDAFNLVRLACHMRDELGHGRVMTIGRRSSIHRHLGFARGEFETMMNEFSFTAAGFAAARAGFVFDTQYFSAYGLVPDMQTGFKCYTRESAGFVAGALDQSAEIAPGLDVGRHGAEIPPIIETLLEGGVIGEINRAAWENQPMTTYDLKGRIEVKGTVLAWVIQRTGIPLDAAARLLANAISRRTMAKENEGRAALIALADWSLEKAACLREEPFIPLRKISYPDYF